jgi:hypothetical protein
MEILEAWNRRRELYIEGHKLMLEGERLSDECAKTYAMCDGVDKNIKTERIYAKAKRLHAQSRKFFAESDILEADGDLIFFSAVIENYGNVDVEFEWDGDGAIICGVKYYYNPGC